MTADKISTFMKAERIGMIYRVYSEEEFYHMSWQLKQ